MICLNAKPNLIHFKLAEMETAGKLKTVITQNIDGLHQLAGSKNVMELHGSVHRNICQGFAVSFTLRNILYKQPSHSSLHLRRNYQT